METLSPLASHPSFHKSLLRNEMESWSGKPGENRKFSNNRGADTNGEESQGLEDIIGRMKIMLKEKV